MGFMVGGLHSVAHGHSPLTAGLAQYRKDYATCHDECKHDSSPRLRDPNPTVVLIPELGLLAGARTRASRV